MDIKVKSEPIEMDDKCSPNLNIKEEQELIIDSEYHWIPMKFENENEYYHELMEERNQNAFPQTFIKNESPSPEFDDYVVDDYCQNDYLDGDGNYMEVDPDGEDNTYLEHETDMEYFTINHLDELEDKETMDTTNCFDSDDRYQLDISKWVTCHYIKRACAECDGHFNYNELQNHVELNHNESIKMSEASYNFNSDKVGVCKKCNMEFASQFSRYLHFLQHEENTKLEVHICKICNFSSEKYFVVKHIVKQHSEVLKEFKNSCYMGNIECLICSKMYITNNRLWYHIRDRHPHEYKQKVRYACHLCSHELFIKEEDFLQHLIEEHMLNSLEMLKFRRIFDDEEYISCMKCNTIFSKYDIHKLLRHFLIHQKSVCWSCKFCLKKIQSKVSVISHMCVEMVRYYEENYNGNSKEDNLKPEENIKLQEFEQHIAHVCPFCNKEFDKMLNWQHHLRTGHEIDTLKGLEMKVISSDKNKLTCLICSTVVSNSPQKLHAHRFLHLPYKPYKCLLCSATLNTFENAHHHILKRCKYEEDKGNVNCVPCVKDNDTPYDIRSNIEIQCSLCDCQIFKDFKSVLKHCDDKHNYCEEFFLKNSDCSMACRICRKSIETNEKRNCFLHLLQHFSEKPFKCKLCLLSFGTFRGAYMHLERLHGAKDVNKQSIDKTNQKEYFLLDKAKDKVPSLAKQSQMGMSPFKSRALKEFADFINYACPECNENMTTIDNWHEHITSLHNFFDESNLYIKDADGSIKCPTCGLKIRDGTTQSQTHKLTHMPYKSFICNLCYARCNSFSMIYAHFRRKHFAQGTFACPICEEILQTAHQRTEHLKGTHPREEWPGNICLICFDVFPTQYRTKRHMITHKSDRLQHTCEICGSKVTHLRSHMARHVMRNEVKQKMADNVTSASTSKRRRVK